MIALNLVPLLSAVIVIMGNHLLSRRRDSSAKFRDGVLEKLDGLYPLAVDWPDDIDTRLRTIFPELQIAVAEFRPYVMCWRRRAFDRAWIRFYCNDEKQCEAENYSQYMNQAARSTFKHNVDHLLSFA